MLGVMLQKRNQRYIFVIRSDCRVLELSITCTMRNICIWNALSRGVICRRGNKNWVCFFYTKMKMSRNVCVQMNCLITLTYLILRFFFPCGIRWLNRPIFYNVCPMKPMKYLEADAALTFKALSKTATVKYQCTMPYWPCITMFISL